ncbi:MAG: transporter substrate-binding domain-containing protein [Kordiimonadaceae bacterium]|nr:transporter substrate-binding domain-containing protein [Kordiimonadaceae bacterium]
MPVVIYTENLPPYNYPDKTGKVVGVSTRQVRMIMEKAGLSYVIKVQPWARAQRNAETEPNTLLYSMVKSDARTPLFDWIVPLVAEPSYLFGRSDDPRVVNAETIRAGKFTAVCAADGRTCSFLTNIGFPEGSLLKITSTGQTLETFKLMMSGRADFAAYTFAAVKSAPFGTSGFEARYQLPTLTTLYLTAGLHVDLGLRDKIRQAYQDLQKEGFLLHPFTPTAPPTLKSPPENPAPLAAPN